MHPLQTLHYSGGEYCDHGDRRSKGKHDLDINEVTTEADHHCCIAQYAYAVLLRVIPGNKVQQVTGVKF